MGAEGQNRPWELGVKSASQWGRRLDWISAEYTYTPSPNITAMYFFNCTSSTQQPKNYYVAKILGRYLPPPTPCPTTITPMPSVVDINIKSYQHLEVLLQLRILILSNYNGQFLTIEFYRLRNRDLVFCKLNINFTHDLCCPFVCCKYLTLHCSFRKDIPEATIE